MDLQLSGHTYGGQLLPVRGFIRMRNIQLGGLQRYGETQLYVTNGVGMNGPPLRVGANADITVMTLRSGRRSLDRPDRCGRRSSSSDTLVRRCGFGRVHRQRHRMPPAVTDHSPKVVTMAT